MMQCVAQAMPVSVRKGGGKAGDTLAPLLQLPGLNQEILKKLRKRKINTLAGACVCTSVCGRGLVGWGHLLDCTALART